ncbi:MAG: M1 family metallopeptidase [Bacteroidetes bacterium]|nr:M1 family metallopeptidase [Bacteroidota bacterium]
MLIKSISWVLVCIYVFIAVATTTAAAQPTPSPFNFDDTLRGTINKDRSWWNVLHYYITITPDFLRKELKGTNKIRYASTGRTNSKMMQIDLQSPLTIDSVIQHGKAVSFIKKGKNTWLIKTDRHKKSNTDSLEIYYSGKPKVAKNPPWDGGWIFTTDKKGRPWMTVACQGLGASVWYPCKDHQSDEPDQGASIKVIAADSLTAVANGRRQAVEKLAAGKTATTWSVVNPINNYNIVPYIGAYTSWTDNYSSSSGNPLALSYWVLDYNLEKATPQFNRDTKRMLAAFEYWFGPYPFQVDGFKLVESPHLGMEHQSAIAYGNGFGNGYRGRDLSGTGWGKDWDYIIIHESGHEWFANNITTKDIADMWVHEGFTMYSEVLFIEYHYGKKAADAYCHGIRSKIRNDRPIVGSYGVNHAGSGDMYNKGAGLIHHIRTMINNDSLFRAILQGMNEEFYHKTVDSKEIEDYFIKKTALPLSPVFDQYLRTTKIPVLEYAVREGALHYRFTNCDPEFAMPVLLDNKPMQEILVNTGWKQILIDHNFSADSISENYYFTKKRVEL